LRKDKKKWAAAKPIIPFKEVDVSYPALNVTQEIVISSDDEIDIEKEVVQGGRPLECVEEIVISSSEEDEGNYCPECLHEYCICDCYEEFDEDEDEECSMDLLEMNM